MANMDVTWLAPGLPVFDGWRQPALTVREELAEEVALATSRSERTEHEVPAAAGGARVDKARDVVLGTWEDAEALVGQVLLSFTGADRVNIPDIRRRLEVLGWDAPIHYDENAARRAGHEGIVSPATMVISWVLPAYWSPGDQRPIPATRCSCPGSRCARYLHLEAHSLRPTVSQAT